MCDLKYMDKKIHIVYLKAQIFIFFSEVINVKSNYQITNKNADNSAR